MARLNLKNWRSWFADHRTHEGGPAKTITPELQLRRSVLACLLWEDQFYEDGVEIAGRIAELVPKVEAGEGGGPCHRSARGDEAAPRAAVAGARDGSSRDAPRAGGRDVGSGHSARRRAD